MDRPPAPDPALRRPVPRLRRGAAGDHLPDLPRNHRRRPDRPERGCTWDRRPGRRNQTEVRRGRPPLHRGNPSWAPEGSGRAGDHDRGLDRAGLAGRGPGPGPSAQDHGGDAADLRAQPERAPGAGRTPRRAEGPRRHDRRAARPSRGARRRTAAIRRQRLTRAAHPAGAHPDPSRRGPQRSESRRRRARRAPPRCQHSPRHFSC